MPLYIDGREIPLEIESAGPEAIGRFLAPKEVVKEAPKVEAPKPEVVVPPTETLIAPQNGENGE